MNSTYFEPSGSTEDGVYNHTCQEAIAEEIANLGLNVSRCVQFCAAKILNVRLENSSNPSRAIAKISDMILT